jgi:hypothetical protein
MWRTSEGERVLQGAEWELFRAGLVEVWDLTEDSFVEGSLFASGIDAFDNLQPAQKLALLALVGKALRDEATPPPELTAHSEGTVAAVFAYICASFHVEIDMSRDPNLAQPATFWRELILAAFREVVEQWEEPLPEPTCDEFGEWDLLLECLSDHIFWDADYTMGRDFLDADPDVSRVKMEEMGIAEDYFRAVAPDPTEEQLTKIRRTLRDITGRSG